MKKILYFVLPLIFCLCFCAGGYLTYSWKVALPQQRIIKGLVVNHHLFASNLIDQAFIAAEADLKPDYTIIISPNHFQLGHEDILTHAPNSLLPELKAEADVFEREHGVKNILPFIKKYFPETIIIPIIVKDRSTSTEIDAWANIIANNLPQNSLIIGSFDFTHQQKDAVADAHDAISQKILENLDYLHATSADMDSHPGLRLFLETLDLRGANQFTLLAHSSSAKITHNYTTTDNTSYLVGMFK